MMNKALTTASVLVAGLASLCCIGPLVAVGIGLSTFGAATFFEGLRPYLLMVAVSLLAAGFYLIYRKPPVEQCVDGLCVVVPPKKTQKLLLWLAAAVVVPLAAFPHYSDVFWAGAYSASSKEPAATASLGEVSEAFLDLEGMTCAGCAVSVQAAVEQKPGVTFAKVNFDKKTAHVQYDASRISVDQLIEAVRDLEFAARPRP